MYIYYTRGAVGKKGVYIYYKKGVYIYYTRGAVGPEILKETGLSYGVCDSL